MCIQMRPLDGPPAVVRTDPAPGFKALANDQLLKHHRLTLELGNAKNCNKNPVAEKAIQELEGELLRQDPLGGAVSDVTLDVATATLNSRIRSRGLSAREMWTQRDQFSNYQLPMNDQNLIASQHEQRSTNHPHSEHSKAPLAQTRPTTLIEVGDLVYLHSDRNKTCARNRYLVVSADGLFCNIKKFVGSQLRSTSYRVKMSECYKVPPGVLDTLRYTRMLHGGDSFADEDQYTILRPKLVPPPAPPHIPKAISTPASQGEQQHDDPAYTTRTSEPRDFPDSVQPDSTEAHVVTRGDDFHQPRRSSRLRRRPARYDDYVIDDNSE